MVSKKAGPLLCDRTYAPCDVRPSIIRDTPSGYREVSGEHQARDDGKPNGEPAHASLLGYHPILFGAFSLSRGMAEMDAAPPMHMIRLARRRQVCGAAAIVSIGLSSDSFRPVGESWTEFVQELRHQCAVHLLNRNFLAASRCQ
jgi:hypothetical protein